jgi:hypothetical protein
VTTLHAGNPTRWGAEKQSLVRSWLPGAKHPEIWAAISTMAPKIFPGADPCAFMGFCANGESLAANTTETVPEEPFHELGIFGTEGGMRFKPAPDPNPNGAMNSWGELHAHPDVVALLGRPATMVAGAWKRAADDQVAIGLVNIRRHARNVFAALGASVAPASEGSLWFVALGFMGWSAGPGRTISHVKPHVAALAIAPEISRWGALMHHVAVSSPTGHKHANPAYSCARTAQKLECGRQLQAFMGPTCSAWYDLHDGMDSAPLYDAIARLGYPQ